jgi:hypothetical protein
MKNHLPWSLPKRWLGESTSTTTENLNIISSFILAGNVCDIKINYNGAISLVMNEEIGSSLFIFSSPCFAFREMVWSFQLYWYRRIFQRLLWIPPKRIPPRVNVPGLGMFPGFSDFRMQSAWGHIQVLWNCEWDGRRTWEAFEIYCSSIASWPSNGIIWM